MEDSCAGVWFSNTCTLIMMILGSPQQPLNHTIISFSWHYMASTACNINSWRSAITISLFSDGVFIPAKPTDIWNLLFIVHCSLILCLITKKMAWWSMTFQALWIQSTLKKTCTKLHANLPMKVFASKQLLLTRLQQPGFRQGGLARQEIS